MVIGSLRPSNQQVGEKDWGGGQGQILGSFRKGEMACAWRNPGGLPGGGRLELCQEG